jgi:hypothetical protein
MSTEKKVIKKPEIKTVEKTEQNKVEKCLHEDIEVKNIFVGNFEESETSEPTAHEVIEIQCTCCYKFAYLPVYRGRA